MRTGWVEGEGGAYLSPRGVRNLNKYLAQACQIREGGGGGVEGVGGHERSPCSIMGGREQVAVR